ncbi:hypothetical protein GIB67_007443, partial [Kingdonia uniflora]
TGVLGHGKSAHGQTVRVGFDLYANVAIEIILVYSKCGNVEEMLYVFRSQGGILDEALEFIQKMPITPNAIIWGLLLSSSRLHVNVHIGVHAADSLLFLEPDCVGTLLQLVNFVCECRLSGCWDKAANMIYKDRGLKIYPMHSWIVQRNEVYRFRVENMSNDKVNGILSVVDGLADNMRRFGSVPNILEGLDL